MRRRSSGYGGRWRNWLGGFLFMNRGCAGRTGRSMRAFEVAELQRGLEALFFGRLKCRTQRSDHLNKRVARLARSRGGYTGDRRPASEGGHYGAKTCPRCCPACADLRARGGAASGAEALFVEGLGAGTKGPIP